MIKHALFPIVLFLTVAAASATPAGAASATPAATPIQPIPLYSASASTTIRAISADEVAVVALDDTNGAVEYEALRSMGVPTRSTTSVTDAVQSHVVILAGTLSYGVLPQSDIDTLTGFVAGGGVVIAEAVTDARLKSLIGYTTLQESASRTTINFRHNDAATSEINTAQESSVVLSDEISNIHIGTVEYTIPGSPGDDHSNDAQGESDDDEDGNGPKALATFEDGKAAVVRSPYGRGAVYTVGARLLDLVQRHWEGARTSVRARTSLWTNSGDTDADVWLLLLRGIYRSSVSGGVTLSTAPSGAKFAVIPTLSANWSAGVAETQKYVTDLKAVGAGVTVFIPTRTATDWLDSGFYSTSPTSPFATQIRSFADAVSAPGTPIAPAALGEAKPVLECVSIEQSITAEDDVVSTMYVAHFGYLNTGSTTLTITRGLNNIFTPFMQDGLQPNSFGAGRHVDVFQVPFVSGNVVWKLGSRTSTASPSSTRCGRTPHVEIGSHGVSHSPTFDKLPVGNPSVTAASYKPFVESKTVTRDGSLEGELRVSKELLQPTYAPALTSFRAPYLEVHRSLAAGEDAVGYRYDSSTTQGWVQSAFPFSAPRFDGRGFANVKVFPIAVEDEKTPNGLRFDARLPQALQVIGNNGANGAPSVILVHPNAADWKRKAYATLLSRIPADGWIGNLNEYGTFWTQRAALALRTTASATCTGGRTIVLTNTGSTVAARQSVDVPGSGLQIATFPDGSRRIVNADQKLTLPEIAVGETLPIELCAR